MRLSEHVETVELRVMDVCSRVDEAVMMAGRSRALIRTYHKRARGAVPENTHPELSRVAHWLVSRRGLDTQLVDVDDGCAGTVQEMIEKLLAFVRPALEEGED